MDKYISVPLKKEGLDMFYESVKNVLGIDSETMIDCRHIEVSQDRMDAIMHYYPEKDRGAGLGMLWVMYGPKVNNELSDEVVKIEKGFIE